MRRLLVTGIAAALVAVPLAGCSPTRPSSRAGSRSSATGTASWVPSGATVRRNVAYGGDPAERLDVYSPSGARDDPIIVMVHGGGWRRGDKAAADVIDNKVAAFLPRGYVVVSTNYPMSQATPVTEAHNVASALAFTQRHAQSWGGDPAKVVLMGHSAGANLVSLIAADPAYATAAHAKPWLGTVSLDSEAYDVPTIMKGPHLPLYDRVFDDDQARWRKSSPALVLSGTPKPMLLVCSSKRSDSCPQADGYAAAVRRQGGTATVTPVDLTHQQIDQHVGLHGTLTATINTFLHALSLP